MTLARKHSLKNQDFAVIKTKGRLFQSSSFAISYLKKPGQTTPRFGFIISTKISPHASLRNRVKRALSEGVRRSLFQIKPHYDYVFLAKPSIIKKYTADLMNEVTDALVRAKLIVLPK